MSDATKGNEREAFIRDFLKQVLPAPFRFGTGDATDKSGNRSGQLDVVVELPFDPSLPIPGASSRLYLAEGIAAVIEVKSDVAKQWPEVLHTAKQLAGLTRNLQEGAIYSGEEPGHKIPLFAVGYTGWKKIEAVKEHLGDSGVSGILVIDEGLYADAGGAAVAGDWALWGLICALHQSTSKIISAQNKPIEYAR